MITEVARFTSLAGRWFLLFAILLPNASLNGASPSENWPQWRGPHLNGTSRSARNLPVRWSATQNVIWRTKLPSWAAATPIVWDDTVFVTSAQEGFVSTSGSGIVDRALNRIKSAFNYSDEILLIALDRKNGEVRWQATIGSGNYIGNKQNMASPSPVTDGRSVWTLTGTGTLTGLDFTGRQLWQRNLPEEYGAFGLQFGYASSPLLHEDRLYIQVLHGMETDGPSYVLAVDARTGDTLWRVERPTDAVHESPDSYSTPTLADVEGETQLIVSGADYVTGHDLDTGRELWRAGGLNPTNATNYRTIASSVVVGDVVMVPTRRKPFIAFQLGANGANSPRRLWSTDYGPDVPTPTTDGERLYIIDDRGIALALQLRDGTTIWDRTRIEPGTYSASPVLADGKIYAMNEEGTTTVLKAGSEFEILAVNKLDDYTLASPAVAGENIFIRTSNYLYCLGKNGATSD